MYLVQHASFIVCSGEVTVGEDTSGPALDVSGSYFCPLHIFVVASTSYCLQACLSCLSYCLFVVGCYSAAVNVDRYH
jgi:hypothetical protein